MAVLIGESAISMVPRAGGLGGIPFLPLAYAGTLASIQITSEVTVERLRPEASTIPRRSLYKDLREISFVDLLRRV